MYELKKNWKGIFTSKSAGTGPSSYEKRIYRAAVSQRLRNTALNTALNNITCLLFAMKTASLAGTNREARNMSCGPQGEDFWME